MLETTILTLNYNFKILENLLLIISFVNFMAQLLSYNTQWLLVSYLVYTQQNMPMSSAQSTSGIIIFGISTASRNSYGYGFLCDVSSLKEKLTKENNRLASQRYTALFLSCYYVTYTGENVTFQPPKQRIEVLDHHFF